MTEPVLAIDGLNVEFASRGGDVRILRDFGFSVGPNETVALVGESGCGKSMTALAAMGLLPPKVRIASGSIRLDGEELVGVATARLTAVRGDRMSMIFQDPMTCLNPVFTVGEQIAESLRTHRGMGRRAAFARAVEALSAVDIPDPARRAAQYPHELSGGMRQRVMIAMAIACEPRLLIADEPTTALDVTVQAQVFDLLRDLRRRTGIAMVLITHDIAAVVEMADRVVVMYAGRTVETGPTAQVVHRPRHPYTKGLVACIPDVDADPAIELAEIPGSVPSLAELGAGCAFADRCDRADEACRTRLPPFTATADAGFACWKPCA